MPFSTVKGGSNLECTNIISQLNEKISTQNIFENELMSKHTSFKIGGPADIYITPSDTREIKHALKVCSIQNIPYYIIGNGSNLLVSDKGYRGVMIQISRNMNKFVIADDIVVVQAGVLLSTLAKEIANHSLKGFEFAAGIPGTLGGAVCMNAGAYGGEMKQVIQSVDAIDQDGNIITLSNKELELGHRTSLIQKKGLVVLSVTLKLEHGCKDDIKALIKDFANRRKEKQPLDMPSAGSTFKRPEGYYAGKLIQDAGLCGYSIGGAAVSQKHCGFIVNKGNATAKDVTDLIKYIQKTIQQKFNVEMSPEVRVIGEE